MASYFFSLRTRFYRIQKGRNPTQNNRGQISIMVGVMMMTFILFFAFVINTGMLVNAKINLQNAADLAAYSGAAVQARQLTQISYLNYEMRRQWKKLLFRLYVIGNMSQDGFPRSSSGGGLCGGSGGPMKYTPNSSNCSLDYGVPTTCVIFNTKDNFCHISTLPKIGTIGNPNDPAAYLDGVTQSLNAQLQAIEQIRQGNCKGIGITNKLLNYYWLFNTDPNFSRLTGDASLDPSQKNSLNLIQGLAYGLGIVPREMLLRYRIKSLNSYVNTPAQKSMTLQGVSALEKKADPAAYERTIQAFYSAYYTLGNWSFPAETVFLDELLPNQILQLKDIQQQIDTYAIDFKLGAGDADLSAALGSKIAQDCISTLVPISTGGKLTVGVYKDPSVLTYYAVRLRATARVLFSPFGDLELKAYAAAQPFGSRIGPPEDQVVFGGGQSSSAPDQVKLGIGTQAQIPNLTIGNGSGGSLTWGSSEVVGTMYESMVSQNGGVLNMNLSSTELEQAYATAMAPNPWEGARYNIMNDAGGGDQFTRNFGVQTLPGRNIQGSVGAFWAPVFTVDQIGNAKTQLTSDLNQILSSTAAIKGSLGGGTSGANASSLMNNVLSGLDVYLAALQNGQGEDGEGNNIVHLTNPFLKPTSGGLQPIGGNTNIFMTTDPADFRTSWNTSNDSSLTKTGRVGYSVKFVSFDSLSSKKMKTDGQGSWSNSFAQDDETNEDLQFIKH